MCPPHTQGAVTCTINVSLVHWYSPPSDNTKVSFLGQVYNGPNTGFTVALESVNNPGLTTNLSFTATTDKSGTQIRCNDTTAINVTSMTCTIMLSGMSMTISHITNMYYYYKILQVMFLQDWVLQLSQTLQSYSTGHLLLVILTV